MYAIQGFQHRSDITLGCHGFSISLHPILKEYVIRSGLNQKKIDYYIEHHKDSMLKAAGYDPQNYRYWLSVRWGDWGPEHISVPGNACGLDIDRTSFGCLFDGGVSLHPHNVDSLTQKYLLMIVFSDLIDHVLVLGRDI